MCNVFPEWGIAWSSASSLSNVTWGKASFLAFHVGVQLQGSYMYWVPLSAKDTWSPSPSYKSIILILPISYKTGISYIYFIGEETEPVNFSPKVMQLVSYRLKILS